MNIVQARQWAFDQLVGQTSYWEAESKLDVPRITRDAEALAGWLVTGVRSVAAADATRASASPASSWSERYVAFIDQHCGVLVGHSEGQDKDWRT